MGVRGTTLDFLIEHTKNTVALKDGQASVCAAGKYVELVKGRRHRSGDGEGSRIDIELQPLSTWSFNSACNGMCSPIMECAHR